MKIKKMAARLILWSLMCIAVAIVAFSGVLMLFIMYSRPDTILFVVAIPLAALGLARLIEWACDNL